MLENTTFVLDAWAVLKDYVPVKDRRAAAEQYMKTAIETGMVDIDSDTDELLGHCRYIDKVISELSSEGDSDATW
jgi:hypothetical protein